MSRVKTKEEIGKDYQIQIAFCQQDITNSKLFINYEDLPEVFVTTQNIRISKQIDEKSTCKTEKFDWWCTIYLNDSTSSLK